MQPLHVNVYRVTEKYETDIDGNEDKARERALEKAKSGSLTKIKPDCEFIAISSVRSQAKDQQWWAGFWNENKAHTDCTLVSAINARYFWTGEITDPDSQEYQDLLDVCECRNGDAASADKAYAALGLTIAETYDTSTDLKNLNRMEKFKLPLEVSVWHNRYGSHSVLIVDHEPIVGAVRVTNLQHATNPFGWVFWEDFYHFVLAAGQSGLNRLIVG